MSAAGTAGLAAGAARSAHAGRRGGGWYCNDLGRVGGALRLLMEDGQGVTHSHFVAVPQPVRDCQPVTIDIGAVRRPEVLEPDAV